METNTQENMLLALDQVMRALRRRPSEKQVLGRGVYRILSLMKDQPGRSTRELAEILDMRASSLNEKLLLLEKEQFIMRKRDPSDQRIFVVELQQKGLDHLEEIKAEREQTTAFIANILTEEELERLTTLALKLATGLQKRVL